MFSFRDELLPVFRLHRLFDIPDAQTQLTSGLLVVISEGQQRCALFVDDLLTQTQVVTKSLGKGINNVPVVAGGAIMGDGTVGLILDTAGIIEHGPTAIKYNNVTNRPYIGGKSMNNATAIKENQSIKVDPRAGKYLTFFLASEEYGVEILKVQEIIGRMPITPVPLTSKYILGVINLRGKIHPIMDLKIKFGMDQTRDYRRDLHHRH